MCELSAMACAIVKIHGGIIHMVATVQKYWLRHLSDCMARINVGSLNWADLWNLALIIYPLLSLTWSDILSNKLLHLISVLQAQ